MRKDEGPGLEEGAELAGAPLPAELTGFIGYLLRRVFTQFNADADVSEADARESVVLATLAAGEYSSQHDLAESLGINRTLMVGVLDRLEERGLVVRTRNPDNRRSYLLSLTDAGRTAARHARADADARDLRLTRALTAHQRERLQGLLAHLLPGGPDPGPADLPVTEYLVAQAHYRIRRIGDDKLAGSGLRVRHFGPLAVLDTRGPCAQQQVASYLAITDPAASALVEELVQADLVLRGRDARDRRRHSLSLTDEGRRVLVLLAATVRELQGDVAALLPPGGDAELMALLTALLADDRQA